MMKNHSTVRLLLLLLVLPASVVVIAQQPDNTPVYGCFDFRNLTCDLPPDAGDTNVDVQETCQQAQDLIQDYYNNSPTNNNTVEYNQQALANITTSDPFCYNIQNVYHKCPQFCSSVTPQEPAGCFDFRNLTCDLTWQDGNPDVNVAETCETIQSLIEQTTTVSPVVSSEDTARYQQAISFLTIQDDLCDRVQQAYHKCWWCGLTAPQEEKCFDNIQVSCDTDQALGYEDFDEDVPTICAELKQAIETATGEPVTTVQDSQQTRLYEQALNYLNATDELCRKAREVYHKCDWCNPPPVTACFDTVDLSCNGPAEDDDDGSTINVNDACLAMEGLIYRDSNYRAVSLVQSDQDTLFHQSILNSLQSDDPLCRAAKQNYQKCWWCAKNVTKYFCQFETCARPDRIDESVDVQSTCQEMQELKDQRFGDGFKYPASIDFCHRAEQAAFACPDLFCELSYLGADTQAKKKALVWLSRTAALLSLGGACFILWDALAHKKNRQAVYHQLLVGMAAFDIVTALAWGFATAPVPDENYWIQGAAGNEATCTAQGFFVQLGFTSVFYNVSLALYYVLVIVRDWREFNLVKIRPYMHGIPVLIGLGLACAGIPFYDWTEYGCHLLPPSANKAQGELWQVLVFAVGPIALSICLISIAMTVVYLKVRKQANKAKKWSASNKGRGGGATRNSLERTVFYQSIFYVLSFTITWPILFALYLGSVDSDTQYATGKQPFGLSATIAFVAPLQGWNNFLVYIRPKLSQWRRDQQKKAEKRKKMANSSTAATAGVSGSSATAVSSKTFLQRLRGSRSSLSISSKFSFLRIRSNKSGSEEAVSEVTTPSNVGNRPSSMAQSKSDSLSKLDSAISSLNSDSSAGPGSHSLIVSDVSQTESITENDDIRGENRSEIVLIEDPSVLIARADRDELLEKYEEQQNRNEDSGTNGVVQQALKFDVPDTIEEGVEEESSQMHLHQPQVHEVAPVLQMDQIVEKTAAPGNQSGQDVQQNGEAKNYFM